MVGYVEKFGAELRGEPLLEFPTLGYGHVQIVKAGIAENVAPGIAEGPKGRRKQDRLGVEADVAASPAMRSAGRKHRSGLSRRQSYLKDSGAKIGAAAVTATRAERNRMRATGLKVSRIAE